MSDKTTLWQEVTQGAGKVLTWILLITLSVIAKLAADSRVAKLTRRDIIIKTILSVFVGVVAAIACESFSIEEWGKVIVPVSTLLGESIIIYTMANWTIILNWLPEWMKKKKEKE